MASDAPAILYVDDEPKALKYFQMAVRGRFEARTADGLVAAERMLAEDGGERIGVLLTDQRMPGGNGTVLLGHVKERYPLVVRLLTTAYSDLDDAVAAVNSGEIHRYIHKPWDLEVLLNELTEACALHKRRREEQKLIEARRETMSALASQLAHEISTPLATVAAGLGGLERHLPTLVEHYRETAGLEATVRPGVLDALAKAPCSMRDGIERALLLARLLLLNAGAGADAAAPKETLSAADLVDEALSTYPFARDERARVRVEGEDFLLQAVPTLALHVLYNLVRNALDAISNTDGFIVINLDPGAQTNTITVTDTGIGISPAAMPRIFEEFFSLKTRSKGTGMGLPFCLRVMRGLGGDIVCESEEGKYTRMELRFPILDLPGAE